MGVVAESIKDVTIGGAVVLREDEAGVATLTLNRPKQFNAMSEAVLKLLPIQAKFHL